MMTSILCAVDVNDAAADTPVLQEAARMAQMHGAQLDVITVLPDFGTSLVGGFFEPEFHGKAEKATEAHLHEMISAALGAEADQAARHMVVTGKAYEQILKAAEKIGSDLIVIGAHRPDLKDYLLGPNAARVVRHATCSVYVVRIAT